MMQVQKQPLARFYGTYLILFADQKMQPDDFEGITFNPKLLGLGGQAIPQEFLEVTCTRIESPILID